MTNVATLQTAADLSASITAQGISSLVPAGAILAFGGATAPTGWLLCNGAAISRVTYLNLFNAIGTAHGYGDNIAVTGTFNLPDYRGRFIRGRDGAVTRDPNAATRTAANTGGNTGDNVGSVQGEATKSNGIALSGSAPSLSSNTVASTAHTHALATSGSDVLTVQAITAGGVNRAVQTNTVPGTNLVATTAGPSANTTVGISGGSYSLGAGDNETRPLNAYVNYIIKI